MALDSASSVQSEKTGKRMNRMTSYELFVPIRTSQKEGFYNVANGEIRHVLGCTVRLLQQTPYHYLVFESVDKANLACKVLPRLKRILPWASLRLGFGITLEPGDLHYTDVRTFNGDVPTITPSSIEARPIRVASGHRSEEPDARLFSALQEGEGIPPLLRGTSDPLVRLSLDLLTTVDFEATSNAQFLTLISALEVLSRPGDRPSVCLDIIGRLVSDIDVHLSTAPAADRQALEDMRKTASQFWIKRSFRSAIRSLARRTAETMNDLDPAGAERKAVSLYDKRSALVHKGQPVTSLDVSELRQLVREVIAVELDCYHHIRERYPTC